MILSAPIVGIFGGAGPPVFRAMMSKIVSADDQGKNACQQGPTEVHNS